MKRRTRWIGYLLAIFLLIGLSGVSPHAWATPEQTRPQQTVPTPTPKGARPTGQPTARPTARPPEATTEPAATEPAAPATPGVATSIATSTPAPELAMVKEVGQEQIWPGATVHYTVTLTNRGRGSAQEIVLTDTLPQGLEPGTVSPASGATWDGRTLRGRLASLPAGGTWVIGFTAIVRADVAPGAVLVNQAQIAAAGGRSASRSAVVALPPAELPPTGGRGAERGSLPENLSENALAGLRPSQGTRSQTASLALSCGGPSEHSDRF